VTRWHLSRAVGKYRKGLRKYLEDILEKERQGTLTPKDSEELEQNRHWAFLRRLIGEEILERHGNILPGSGRSDASELARAFAPHLEMATEEVEKHFEPLFSGGNIYLERNERGNLRCGWA